MDQYTFTLTRHHDNDESRESGKIVSQTKHHILASSQAEAEETAHHYHIGANQSNRKPCTYILLSDVVKLEK